MDEIKKLIEEMNKAFEAFKAENDTRLKQVEARGDSDPLLDEKMKAITDDIAKMAEMQLKLEAVERAVAEGQVPKMDDDNEKIYSSLGEQLKDIVTMAHPDRSRTEYAEAADRLKKVRAAATGANELSPSEGGFLVQQDYAGILDQGAINTGILSSRCFKVPISGMANGVKTNLMDETSRANGSRYGGIQVYWEAEAATTTATKPKFRQLELSLKKLFGLFYATEELLRDAAAMTAMVNKWFPAEFGFKIDDGIINGTGAGQPLGVLNSDCIVSVAKETGQAAETVVFQNIVKMYSRLLDSSDKNAVWYINRDILPQLFTMSLAVGTGGVPVFLPASGAADRPYMTLMGKPLLPIEQCSTLGTVGDILLLDLDEYMLIEKGGIKSAVSIHVRFIYDEQTFKWTYRIDGQPIRKSALTPYKGSNTRSPFISLATRA